MRLFDTKVQELKYKVLKEIVSHYKAGTLDTGKNDIPQIIAPGPKPITRCCVYHERAILEERVKISLDNSREKKSIVELIQSACDECPFGSYYVTDACRGCVAHRCESDCPVGAVSFHGTYSTIDQDKCIECGKCAANCPYEAISKKFRPCVKACKVNAIKPSEDKKIEIDKDKCIDCGSCVYHCPFGAIQDRSFIVDCLDLLNKEKTTSKVYAVLAPAIVSQFTYASIGQIITGLKTIGFTDVIEAALGADSIAYQEAHELAEKGFLTSSCCPSFVKYVEKFHPKMKEHISHNLSPMAEMGRIIKEMHPDAKVVFIGPCVSKKAEFLKDNVSKYIDCVITFEELQALFDGNSLEIEKMEESPLNNASYYGRIFARSGGVSEAAEAVVKAENLDFEVKAEKCNGIDECKIALLKAARPGYDKNFIEGMCCVGGCIGGAGCLHHYPKDKIVVDKFASEAKEKTIAQSLEVFKNHIPGLDK